MKKLTLISIVICLFISLSITAFAYSYSVENSYSIEMPDDFSQVGEGRFISKDNSSFGITVREKKDKNYCIENMSDKKLLEQAKKEAESGKDGFASLGKKGGIEVVSCQKVKHPNGKTASVTVYKTFMEKDGKEVSHLQKLYLFSCIENDYTFVYTPYDDKNIDSLDSSFDSIVIEEADAKSTVDKLLEMIPLGIIILLFLLGIFKFIRGRKK